MKYLDNMNKMVKKSSDFPLELGEQNYVCQENIDGAIPNLFLKSIRRATLYKQKTN